MAIDDRLFQLPLAEFTAARNRLAAELKKSGHAEDAERVKAAQKPPLSAWVVNQIYWRHRKAFDRSLAVGNRLREAQAAQLAGRRVDLRAPLDARRASLATLLTLANDVLHEAALPSSPDTIRKVMATLEAVTAYGGGLNAPPAGRLTHDVAPPGFEVLAALVPRGGPSARRSSTPPRVISFKQSGKAGAHTKVGGPERRAAARVALRATLRAAERALAAATRAAERARNAMKAAAARAKDTETAKAEAEARFEAASAAADAARLDARRVAGHAEEAAQAMDDAERAVTAARTALEQTTLERH